MVPSQEDRTQRCDGLRGNSRDRFQIRSISVVGRSCRRWHLGPGVKWDVPLGPGHLGRCNGRRVSPPGQDTPGTSHLVQCVGAGADRQRTPVCCSGGVSSNNGTSESRSSHDAPAGQGRRRPQRRRHRSTLLATGLHQEGFLTSILIATAQAFSGVHTGNLQGSRREQKRRTGGAGFPDRPPGAADDPSHRACQT